MGNSPEIKLLNNCCDKKTESYFRLLVDDKQIKYLTVEPGTYKNAEMCFPPTLYTVLPRFPAGNWNDGVVAKDEDGRPYFTSINLTEFPGVENTWHETFIDYMDVKLDERLHGETHEAKCPQFDETVIAKYKPWHFYMHFMENETTVYQLLDGRGIGPRFLGHLTEYGRVIGFLIERIPDARHAGPEDIDLCRETLSRLHALGLHHGDTNRHNFLISNGKAILIDFEFTKKCDDEDMLQQEMEGLPARLADPSHGGGRGSTEIFYGTYEEMMDPDCF
ncbi:alpha-galactosidase A precursor [Aspergillus uvarum CBS 121591]|uniref:Alpha-galactosidase A n=1 Tax=Aspergillus uvarum CBS 121591 TaxID=1448315 RepID=A0A319C9U9_9EURO|nr:alpha-galactosidase A precursor [Aspergillus uvarum CBS 121591]PYH80970.1 alpha-galactosidase A precursor [Aspergillus uvarum CBS 121591]